MMAKNDELSFDDKVIVLPPMSEDKDKDTNEYIERVIANAQDSIEKARKEQEIEKQQKVKETEMTQIEEKKTEEENIIEKKENPKGLRKLTNLEKILIVLLMILPGIQILLMVVASAKIYFIYSIISLVFVFLLSHGCKQYSMVFVHIIMMVLSLFIVISGYDHGMINEDLSKRSVINISYLNGHTPNKSDYSDTSENAIKSELTGKFIYYYKYGCKDCAAIDTQLKALFSEGSYEVIPIETRSEIGKKLLELYPVDEVPAGLVINEDGTYTKRVIYTTDKDGKSVIDNEKLGELLYEFEKEVPSDEN